MKGPNFPSKSPNELTACAASSGYVYCSTQNVNGGNGTSEFYYLKTPSSFSADNESGASANQEKWNQTTTYPPTVAGSESCAGYQGYIYCSGGVRASGYGTGESYYASITSDGTLSGWLQMKSNPANTYFDNLGGCVATDGYLQCGAYFAPIPQSGGIGDWIKMSNYPLYVVYDSCVGDSGFVYCVGGWIPYAGERENVYYVQFAATKSQNTTKVSLTTTSTN